MARQLLGHGQGDEFSSPGMQCIYLPMPIHTCGASRSIWSCLCTHKHTHSNLF